jgi:tetratricopeptide (TPR) repeat protein
MEPIELTHVGRALAEIGEIRRRMGDLCAAEEAFARAADVGVNPQPGLALLQLVRGDTAAAATSISVALAEEGWDRLARARLLPARVEIALASGDADAAGSAAAEPAELAATYASPGLVAAAQCAHGAVLLASGDVAGAVETLQRSVQRWREASAPYHAARARMQLAQALLRQSDQHSASGELNAARATFESLGARLDLERAVALVSATEAASASRSL